MKKKRTKVEQTVETDDPALEGRQMAAETEEGGCATIEEIRKGLFGFMPAITQHMHFPEREGGRCPVCGSKVVTSRIRRSWIIVDGPTYLEMKCGACGHTWRMLLRAGP